MKQAPKIINPQEEGDLFTIKVNQSHKSSIPENEDRALYSNRLQDSIGLSQEQQHIRRTNPKEQKSLRGEGVDISLAKSSK